MHRLVPLVRNSLPILLNCLNFRNYSMPPANRWSHRLGNHLIRHLVIHWNRHPGSRWNRRLASRLPNPVNHRESHLLDHLQGLRRLDFHPDLPLRRPGHLPLRFHPDRQPSARRSGPPFVRHCRPNHSKDRAARDMFLHPAQRDRCSEQDRMTTDLYRPLGDSACHPG